MRLRPVHAIVTLAPLLQPLSLLPAGIASAAPHGGGGGSGGGGGGSGGCNPFQIGTASGELYCFAQADGLSQSLTVPATADALLGAEVFGQRAINTPIDPNYAFSQGFIMLAQGDLFGVDVLGRGSAQAGSGYAFARTDATAYVNLSTSTVQRVQGFYSIHGQGISDLMIRLREVGAVDSVIEASVSTYITPDSVEGNFVVMLPATDYSFQVYGTVQANSSFANPDQGLYGGYMYMSCVQPADVDGSGTIDAGDLSLMLASWGGAAPYHIADLDQDGFVGAADLALLLAAWD